MMADHHDSISESRTSNAPPDMFGAMLTPNLGLMTTMLNPVLNANISMLRWHAAYCRQLADAYKEGLEFLGHRLEEDAKFAEKICVAKEPEALANACSSFLRTAATDYQEEISEMTKLQRTMSNMATDALQDVSVPRDSGAVMGE